MARLLQKCNRSDRVGHNIALGRADFAVRVRFDLRTDGLALLARLYRNYIYRYIFKAMYVVISPKAVSATFVNCVRGSR